MKLHTDILQGSPKWFELRTKYPLTASNAQAIATGGKGLETLCYAKMAERYSSQPKEQYTNDDLERGIELESQARGVYELNTGTTVELVGFVTNEEISPVGGASPDALVGDDGLLEIKCPKDEKYFKMLATEIEIESKHMWQMQTQMLFTERKWCDYMLYNPNFKTSYLIKRVEVDEEMVDKIKAGLKIGEQIIKDIESKLK